MKNLKYLILTFLIALLIFPVAVFAANPSPELLDFTRETGDDYHLEYSVKGWEYDGSYRYPFVSITLVKNVNGEIIRTLLKEGVDYVFEDATGAGTLGKHKKATTQKTKVYGIGKFSGDKVFTYNVTKSKGKFSTNIKKKSFKKKDLNNKAKIFKIKVKYDKKTKNFKHKKIKYSKSKTKKKLRKYIKVSKKGKVSLSKKAPKGTYKITVKLKSTENYTGMSKTITIKVI